MARFRTAATPKRPPTITSRRRIQKKRPLIMRAAQLIHYTRLRPTSIGYPQCRWWKEGEENENSNQIEAKRLKLEVKFHHLATTSTRTIITTLLTPPRRRVIEGECFFQRRPDTWLRMKFAKLCGKLWNERMPRERERSKNITSVLVS